MSEENFTLVELGIMQLAMRTLLEMQPESVSEHRRDLTERLGKLYAERLGKQPPESIVLEAVKIP